MMVFGKLIAGAIGLLAGGIPGLLIGLIIGHAFDRGLSRTLGAGSPENLALIQARFFETTFRLLGYLAKADGRISQQEVDHTEAVIRQMGLGADQRQRAIDLFREGAAAEFDPAAAVSGFNEICGAHPLLRQTLLTSLIALALADGHQLQDAERAALQRVAGFMGVDPAQLARLLQMMQAQEQFHDQDREQSGGEDAIAAAYRALGVDADCDEKTLKRAYRKLMSQHHPDKLIAQGVPESMIRLATEKSQEIQSAYELVRRHRAHAN